MPVRRKCVRVLGGPQGPDAVIVVKYPTVDVQQAHSQDLRSLGSASVEAERVAREFLSEHILEWNWVDEQGDPLPQPYENPEVFGQLYQTEILFLGRSMAGQEPAEDPPPVKMGISKAKSKKTH